MIETPHNGYTNHATWNVALWINNDEWIYNTAKECSSYNEFVHVMKDFGATETPDHVSYTDESLDLSELSELINEL